ncbi:hypothetical protein [Burkholderia multivorans]|uniref:hypothetical protein n=1 Tax=Burkholderia multivorans TaxID=87883 RepID=UPI0009E0CCBA|nr:hypothetical protein [Burkholderia multivorans]MDN8078330.1 hypothetical protein [Burkholderia multivorans]SAJ91493.1 hypothetical protein UA11_04718 [Burkholderia multivorans]
MSDLFYVQDSRNYVGNDVMWWALGGNGYTTDLRRAQTYTREEAQAMHNERTTDIPWPKEYIDGKTRPAVDMQYISRVAILAAGITLAKPKKQRSYTPNCAGCGRFLRDTDRYAFDCPNCGTDNRP